MISKRYLVCWKGIKSCCVKSYSSKKTPIISCKRKELDFYGRSGDSNLASQGWGHSGSRGDYFIIHRDTNSSMQNAINPESYFSDFNLDKDLVNTIAKQDIINPTDIQSKSIPLLLSRRNALITAETGCGKTLAYLLPVIQSLLNFKDIKKEFNSPLALVLTPTRELAMQIASVAEELCKGRNIEVKSLIGGRTKQKILNPSFGNVDLLVSSFGAFSKLVTTGIYKIDKLQHVVLDEADSLLDDSFIGKLSHLLKKIKFAYHALDENNVQLILVSATMPRQLPETVSKFIDPKSIVEVSSTELHKILPHVPQRFLRLGQSQKPVQLLKLVRADVNNKTPVMIFTNRNPTCDWLSMFLKENNIDCVNINGSMPSLIKMQHYESFLSGEVNVLSCTDIASRGLDTLKTRHIINYDFPLYSADYIHRCGRTGRLGSSLDCKVTNFVSSTREIELVQKIELSIRNMTNLPNVNANISKLITDRIQREIDASENLLMSRKV